MKYIVIKLIVINAIKAYLAGLLMISSENLYDKNAIEIIKGDDKTRLPAM
jgi:hypothetical protein